MTQGDRSSVIYVARKEAAELGADHRVIHAIRLSLYGGATVTGKAYICAADSKQRTACSLAPGWMNPMARIGLDPPLEYCRTIG